MKSKSKPKPKKKFSLRHHCSNCGGVHPICGGPAKDLVEAVTIAVRTICNGRGFVDENGNLIERFIVQEDDASSNWTMSRVVILRWNKQQSVIESDWIINGNKRIFDEKLNSINERNFILACCPFGATFGNNLVRIEAKCRTKKASIEAILRQKLRLVL